MLHVYPTSFGAAKDVRCIHVQEQKLLLDTGMLYSDHFTGLYYYPFCHVQ